MKYNQIFLISRNIHLALLGKTVLLLFNKLFFSYYHTNVSVRKINEKSPLTILLKHMAIKFSRTVHHTDHNIYCLVNSKFNPCPLQWT